MNNKLDILLKEYELIQNYTLNTIPPSKNSILSFGLAILGALFTSNIILLSTNNYSDVSILLFLLVIPLASITIMFIWLGEVDRMTRASAFLITIEQQINQLSNDKIFKWGEYSRIKKNIIEYPDFFALCIFFGVNAISIFLGIYVPSNEAYPSKTIIIIYDLFFNSVFISIVYKITYKIRNMNYTQIN